MEFSNQPDKCFSGCAEPSMPESHVNDPVRWRNNAKEMRVLAKGAKDAATRRIMNRLADGWDKLACRAERRARNGSNIAKPPGLLRR